MRRSLQVLSLTLIAAVSGGCYLSVPFDGLARGTPAPGFEVERWINSPQEGGVAWGRGSSPVLLEFWSMDCGPCRSNVAKMRAVDHAYEGRLDVVSVHVSLQDDPRQDATRIAEYVRAQGIDYPVGIDASGELWDLYDFGYLPHAVLIDTESRVVWSGNILLHNVIEVVRRRVGEPGSMIEYDHTAASASDHDQCGADACRGPR